MEVKEMESTYDTCRKALEQLNQLGALLDLEALTNNADKIIQKAGDKNVRIASKSIRSVDVLKKLFSMSDQFQGIMNFTAEEALFLYEQGFDDLLVAYPAWDKQLVQSVCPAIKEGATITLMIDSIEHIERLENIAEEMDGEFFVGIDNHL